MSKAISLSAFHKIIFIVGTVAFVAVASRANMLRWSPAGPVVPSFEKRDLDLEPMASSTCWPRNPLPDVSRLGSGLSIFESHETPGLLQPAGPNARCAESSESMSQGQLSAER